jgi:hypothetical protein
MKKSKVIPAPAREAWFVDMRPHPVDPKVGIVLLVGVALTVGYCFLTLPGKLAHASPPNLVTTPAYSDTKAGDEDSDEYPKPELKYQYEPMSDEKPILHKKAQKDEMAGGVEYDEGDELVVEPESEELAVNLAPIIEKGGEGDLSTPAPSPSPSPSPKAAERDIGKRTAEVR